MRKGSLLRSFGPFALANCLSVLLIAASTTTTRAQVPVGVAVEDITPDYPIRLMGYGSRKTESAGIASRLKARALAIGADQTADGGGPAVLVAVDNCAVGANVTEEVAARLKNKVGLKRERFAVCSTHTHCAPALNSELDFIFGAPIPDDQKARIARYTRELTDAIEKVARCCAGGPVASHPVVGPGPGRLRSQSTGLERRSLDQLRCQSEWTGRP